MKLSCVRSATKTVNDKQIGNLKGRNSIGNEKEGGGRSGGNVTGRGAKRGRKSVESDFEAKKEREKERGVGERIEKDKARKGTRGKERKRREETDGELSYLVKQTDETGQWFPAKRRDEVANGLRCWCNW